MLGIIICGMQVGLECLEGQCLFCGSVLDWLEALASLWFANGVNADEEVSTNLSGSVPQVN